MAKKKSEAKEKKQPKAKPEGYKFGRPTEYTTELGDRICKLVATNTCGLKKLCASHDWMPAHNTIAEWRWKNDDFSTRYTKAKLQQAELLAEDCLDIADNSSQDIKLNASGDEVCNSEFVNRSRLRVDTRKWLTSKLLPKIYGELSKLDVLQGENEELKKEMKELREMLDKKHKKEY